MVLRRWRGHRYSESTIRGYRAWIKRHRTDCELGECDEFEALTREHTVTLAKRYAPKLGLTELRGFVPAQSALRAWSASLAAIGVQVPPWVPPRPPSPFLDVVRYWSALGYSPAVIQQYLVWMKRHYERYGAVRPDKLSRRDALQFARHYVRAHGLAESSLDTAHSAFRTWAKTLAALGTGVPPWVPPQPPGRFESILADYRDFRRRLRGVRESTLELECRHVRALLQLLRERRRPLSSITIPDIDGFLSGVRRGRALSTVASYCDSLRSFLRFLHSTGRVSTDLARDVVAPRHRHMPEPPRGLSWSDVRKFLRAINRSTLIGKRDYAAFLLMASYGMGSGEVRGLSLDDIDWREGTLRTVRAKTGVVTILPLLGPVGEAMVAYLRAGRPRPPSVRFVFLRAFAPPAPLSPLLLRRRFRVHAAAAGISATVSTHAFRHSHATRQVESAAPPRVVSDILGHSDPSSLSSYARVAIEKLRAVCLPMP